MTFTNSSCICTPISLLCGEKKTSNSFISDNNGTFMSIKCAKLGQVLKHQRPATGLFRKIAFPQGKTWRLLARYILFVRDVSRRWNAVITLHYLKRSNTMPQNRTKSKLENICQGATSQFQISFNRLWWTGPFPWYGLQSKRRNVTGEWLWKSCWGDMKRHWSQSILFFSHLSGTTCQNSNLCIFTCDTCVQHIEYI